MSSDFVARWFWDPENGEFWELRYNQFLWSIRVNLTETFQYETPCIRKATTALVQYYSVLYDINRTIMWCSFSRGPIYLDHKRRSNRLVRYGSVMTQRFLEGSLSVLYIPQWRSKMSHLKFIYILKRLQNLTKSPP